MSSSKFILDMWGEDGPSAIWRNFTKAMTERVQNHPLYPEEKDSLDELLDQAIMEQLTLYGATTDWEDFDDPLHFPDQSSRTMFLLTWS